MSRKSFYHRVLEVSEKTFLPRSTTEFHGNRRTAPRQGALTDKCDTLPRTMKATVYSNASWIYQEGSLRPVGSVEVQEGNLRPAGSVEVQEGNLRPVGSVEVQEGCVAEEKAIFVSKLRGTP